ncbi:MAG: TPM domain-containing protein [Lachnospiraceae bacterium]|nr:TPM domain-containing protein [Lachnospiraceae bacterium]
MKRKKYKMSRLFAFLLAAIISLSFALSVLAVNETKIVDMADLLDEEEENALQRQFVKIAEEYECDVVVVTTDSCGGKSPQDYTDDYYYENGYGYGQDIDGIMLMVAMKERKFHLGTRGAAIDIFTDYGLQRIDDLITPDLSDGEYYKAFKKFGELAKEFIAEAETKEPFSEAHPYKEKMGLGLRLLISLIAGLVAAVIVLAVLFGQLRSVRTKREAQDYVRDGSFHVKRKRDLYLYSTVTKIKKEKPQSSGSSTHSTSDGGRAGGHTGSF